MLAPRAWKGVSFGPGKGVVTPGSFWYVPTYFDIKYPLEGGVCVYGGGGNGQSARGDEITEQRRDHHGIYGQAHIVRISVLIAYAQILPTNADAEVHIAGGINFGLKLQLNTYFVFTLSTDIPCTGTDGIISRDM